MDEGVQSNEAPETVKETAHGSKEFRGSVEQSDPNAPRMTPAPDGIPEKFWDADKGELRQDDLLKSYRELEKRIGQPKDDIEETDEEAGEAADEETEEKSEEQDEDADGGDDQDDNADDENEEEGDASAPLADVMQTAQDAYAETGELSAEARAPLHAAGINDEQIDFYLAGVKATEAALQSAAVKAAGSEEDLAAAQQWAVANWSDKKKLAFNAQTGDVETVGTAYAGLMAEFRAAVPGEGRLQNKTTGMSRGDVYTDMDAFGQDLAEADRLRDPVKRRAVLAKMRRSRQAGTIKTNRRQPFGN